MGAVLHPAGSRARSDGAGVTTWHALSSGRHYDPANTAFGPLVAHDEHVLAPGAGFPAHLHRDVEVVSWVVEGALRHDADVGGPAELHPGHVQRLAAGRGVVHTEHAGAAGARFVQAWLLPDAVGGRPSYERFDVADRLAGCDLVPVASARPQDGAPLGLGVTGAALHVGQLPIGARVDLPDAPLLHLHVVGGAVDLAGVGLLGAGDAARLTDAAPGLTATADAEVLVWLFGARAAG